MFRLNIPGETLSPLVSLEIVNIDDNPPIIEVFQACQVDVSTQSHTIICFYHSMSSHSRCNEPLGSPVVVDIALPRSSHRVTNLCYAAIDFYNPALTSVLFSICEGLR